MKRVVVLLLNYATYEDTLRYVANVRKQEGIRLSVLIVDNCSPNESYRVLAEAFRQDPAVEVIQSERNGGYAYGNNYGLRYLREWPVDYVLVSNNDILLDDPFLIHQLVDIYPSLHKPAFIAPRMVVDGREDDKHQAWRLPAFRHELLLSLRSLYAIGRLLGLANHYRFRDDEQGVYAVDCLSGSFFLGSKAVFFRLGLFDERTFLYMEENILACKVRREGLQNYFLRSAQFRHDIGKTTRSFHSLPYLQKIRLASTSYYLRRYRGAPYWQLRLLRSTYRLWLLETKLLGAWRRLRAYFR